MKGNLFEAVLDDHLEKLMVVRPSPSPAFTTGRSAELLLGGGGKPCWAGSANESEASSIGLDLKTHVTAAELDTRGT